LSEKEEKDPRKKALRMTMHRGFSFVTRERKERKGGVKVLNKGEEKRRTKRSLLLRKKKIPRKGGLRRTISFTKRNVRERKEGGGGYLLIKRGGRKHLFYQRGEGEVEGNKLGEENFSKGGTILFMNHRKKASRDHPGKKRTTEGGDTGRDPFTHY